MEEANFNFCLNDGSHCIGSGVHSVEVNGIWHRTPKIDFEGNLRPNPSGSAPDIGAYESNSSK